MLNHWGPGAGTQKGKGKGIYISTQLLDSGDLGKWDCDDYWIEFDG